METIYTKAEACDYDEIIDLANYVFSHSNEPTDFPAVLPKLYKREYFSDSSHYIVREDGRIKAIIGAYPLALHIGSLSLPGRGIGMVSVHPYSRKKGYMKALMDMALDDMKKDGMVFSALAGQRQRYEHFGYTPTGFSITFYGDDKNISSKQHDASHQLSLQEIKPGDTALLDSVQALHQKKRAFFFRKRERLYDTLVSWQAKAYAVLADGAFAGYGIQNSNDDEMLLSEINLYDNALMRQTLSLFLEKSGKKSAEIRANPFDVEKIAALSTFTQASAIHPAYLFNVFDYQPLLSALLQLSASYKTLLPGHFTVKIEGEAALLRILVTQDGKTDVSLCPENTQADCCLSRLEAQSFFFSPLASASFPLIRQEPFLQSLLPLPLFYERADEI
jgi:predicted N-acetyltransferase YhbS